MKRISAALVALALIASPLHADGIQNPGATLTTGQLPGTATNDNATAGNVGQYLSSIVLSGAAVALTTNTPLDVATLTLTAGDWDLQGLCASQPASSAVSTTFICNVTTVANTLVNVPADGTAMGFNNSTQTANGGQSVTTDTARVSISGSTTYHLVMQVTYSPGTLGGYGKLRARRVR
jgi:hypothetical protein